MTISIITPWVNGVETLLADYAAATEGAEIVTVDNASDPADADALRAFTEPRGAYLRNDTNAGFAAGNNQGVAAATGDIVVFLNSDIAGDPAWLRAVAAEVRDGALYGPSLGQQLVAGVFLPYLEGWCVAATWATWERLTSAQNQARTEAVQKFSRGKRGVGYVMAPDPLPGPWDAGAYPGPYWEDNDLCLRALQAGIALVQTAWPLQHKGGRTAGALAKHAASFAANERTYTERVLSLLPRITPLAIPATPVQSAYMAYCAQPSDIQHHLPLLFALARGNVLELGTRSGVSTAALLAGVEMRGGHVYSVDIDPRSANVAAGHPQWTFKAGSSTDPQIAAQVYRNAGGNFSAVLIDTLHTDAQVTAELELWAEYVAPGGTICIHDPETFPGVRAAAERFCAARGWPVTFVLPCNGMAVIEVPA